MYKSTAFSKDKGTLCSAEINVCGALLYWVRGTYPVKQSKVTLQKAEKKQLKTNPQYYVRL